MERKAIEEDTFKLIELHGLVNILIAAREWNAARMRELLKNSDEHESELVEMQDIETGLTMAIGGAENLEG